MKSDFYEEFVYDFDRGDELAVGTKLPRTEY